MLSCASTDSDSGTSLPTRLGSNQCDERAGPDQDFTLNWSGERSVTCGGDLVGSAGVPFQDPQHGPSLAAIGRITSVDSNSFTVTPCSATACDGGCAETHVRVDGPALPDFASILSLGAFVQVSTSAYDFYGCHFNLVVRNVASLCGSQSPVAADDRTYLVVSFGSVEQDGAVFFESVKDDASSFSIRSLSLGCTDTGINAALVYDLEVGVIGAPTTARVSMGQTVSFSGLAGDNYEIHDVRSYAPFHSTDDFWNWSYWIARKP
jgi:hypothetical protein